MKKVFVFCIGGTGERVMKSITMLMAAGMSTNGYTVIPVIIDPHLDLDEKTNLQTLNDKYIAINKSLKKDENAPIGYFNSEMQLIGNINTQTNNVNKEAGDDRPFSEFLNVGNLGKNSLNNYLVQTLYTTDSLNSRLSVGFRGNPNVGTVVLEEMLSGASWYDAFKNHCGQDDRVFIISSIFGGTGASGYPLLERKIRETKDSQTVSKVFMGAVTVLPYYGLTDAKKNNSKIDSANFKTKAKAALAYYENTVKSDLLYYVGESELQAYHENDEKKQEDKANFIELVAASALFDFLQRVRPKERQYLTRAIKEDVPSIDLSTAGDGYASIVKCIADFKILSCLMDVLPKEKYFPLKATMGMDDVFYKNDMASIYEFRQDFEKWTEELANKNRKFVPITEITPSNMGDIIRNSKSLAAKDDSYYLLEMIKNAKNSSGNKVRDFMEYAYKAIDTYTKEIIK
jgi:hypothetical protein